jgi:cytidine deaminase
VEIDWTKLRAAATDAMRHAYAPYSKFPVGAAGLVEDGRVVVGCNVENAAYGVVLCAECGLVSALHTSGGGRLVAVSCVDGAGEPLMPCGRCRQLLWEHGGPQCLVDAVPTPRTVADLLPYAFDINDLGNDTAAEPEVPAVPERLLSWRGRGTVFVHPDLVGDQRVWTAYWDRGAGADGEAVGLLEEGQQWPGTDAAVAWGLARTPRVVVVDADGTAYWAGEGEPPSEIGRRWSGAA